MPSIMYTDDEGAREGRQRAQSGDAPEPPVRYQPQMQPSMAPQPGNDGQDFNSARRMISAAQIMALVSLVIGGVLLSSIALVVAIRAYRKVTAAIGSTAAGDASWLALKRLGTVALVMSVVALGVNVVTLVVVYPMVVDMLQSSDYRSLWGNGTEIAPTADSVWG